MFFNADDGIHGRELWKSDGTKAGTVLVKAIDPKDEDGEYEEENGPASLTRVGGTLFFTIDDGIHGRELWKSDGTKAGTVLVKAVVPDDGGGYDDEGPSSLTRVGGTLFFTADDGIHGSELWKSDGTTAGTVLVKDIDPDDDGGYDDESGPYFLTGVGGTLFFTAGDGIHGSELWKSDGTRAGTVLVKDIHPGDYDGHASSLADVRGTLFFTARDGIHGRELWKSDGTRAGTVLVKDIHPRARDSEAAALTGVGGRLFFTADDGIHGPGLWKSDGTRAGTVLVKGIGFDDYYDDYGPNLTGVGGTLFFTADDGTHGSELWESNGTRAGTVLVKDIHADAYDSGPSYLEGVGDTLFFTARDGTHGSELWKSDGTRAGTVLVKDIRPGTGYGYDPESLTGVGGTLFFAADDGTRGSELWKSNGTAAGTVLVRDINAGGEFRVASRGQADTSRGTLRLRVAVAGAGRLVARPVGGSVGKLKWSAREVDSAGTTSITLRPTRAGLSILRREGQLRVKARFIFTPCGGPGSSVTRQYTLRLQ